MESDNTMRSYREFKKIFIFFVLIVLSVLLTGCCFQHEWTEATCTTPQTCTKCSKTEGEPLPHEWENATCTSPQTCKVCGVAQGTALGHDWIDATCTEPKKCKVCEKIEGEPLGHNYSSYKDFVCARCNEEKVFNIWDDIDEMSRMAELDYPEFRKTYLDRKMLFEIRVSENNTKFHYIRGGIASLAYFHYGSDDELSSIEEGSLIIIETKVGTPYKIFGAVNHNFYESHVVKIFDFSKKEFVAFH